MPNPCYPSCPPPVHTILNHAPPLVHHLAFTGAPVYGDLWAAGVCLAVGGILIAIEERLRRGASRS